MIKQPLRALETLTRTVMQERSLEPIIAVAFDQAIHRLGAMFTLVHLISPDSGVLDLVAHRQVPGDLLPRLARIEPGVTSLIGRAHAAGAPQVVSTPDELSAEHTITREIFELTGCRAMLAMPLIAYRRRVGVLTLAFDHDLDPDERVSLETLVQIMAVELANVVLDQRERRLRALLGALERSATSLATQLELRPTLQAITDTARRLLNADCAALGIVRSPAAAFEPWVFSGITPEQEAKIGPPPRPVGLLGAVALEGKIIRVSDVRQDPRFRGLPAHHPELGSFLGVPILYSGASVGNLYFANLGDHPFTLEDEQAAVVLAAQAGVAVHHATLDTERSRFAAITMGAPFAVWFVASESEAILANARAAELTGQAELAAFGDYRGQLCRLDGQPLLPAELPWRRVLGGEPASAGELILRRPDGASVPILLSASPISRPGRGIEGVIVVFDDLSTLKAEGRLRDEWIAIVTHDMRQPLLTLQLYLDQLLIVVEQSDPVVIEKVLDRTRRTLATIGRMVGDLSDTSKLDTEELRLERQATDLGMLIGNQVACQRALNPHRVIYLTADPVPEVSVDPLRITQILDNLLTNAIKYSDPSSPIHVAIRKEPRQIHISVTNRGPGIPQEELSSIFDRFHRVRHVRHKRPGLGLGLYICRGLVRAHGGQIWAESVPGETTTFHVTLPLPGAPG